MSISSLQPVLKRTLALAPFGWLLPCPWRVQERTESAATSDILQLNGFSVRGAHNRAPREKATSSFSVLHVQLKNLSLRALPLVLIDIPRWVCFLSVKGCQRLKLGRSRTRFVSCVTSSAACLLNRAHARQPKSLAGAKHGAIETLLLRGNAVQRSAAVCV